MSKASDAANAVMNSIEQVCGLYGVESLRMQSRTITVVDNRRQEGFRPMFFGKWRDEFGEYHHKGMADMLLRPRVPVNYLFEEMYCGDGPSFITTMLWVEAKSGKGKVSSDQLAFKRYVEWNGEQWMEIHDDITPLLDWFKAHGVNRDNFPIPPRPVSVPVTEISNLPCRHCGELRSDHQGKILACKKPSAMGKVYSPKIPKK